MISGPVAVLAGPERDHRLDGLAPAVVGHADDRDLGHGRVLGQDLLDLGRVDVLPAGDDHVLEPVLDEEVAVVVDVPDVAGAEPAVVGDRLGGVVGLVQVAHHPLRRAEPELARLARGDVLEPVAGSTTRTSAPGSSVPAETSRSGRGGVPVRLRGQGADHAGQLGHGRRPGRSSVSGHAASAWRSIGKRHRRGPVEQVLQPAQRGDGLLARRRAARTPPPAPGTRGWPRRRTPPAATPGQARG